VVLLLVAADRVDLGHARHRAHLRLDDPVLDLAQVHRVVWRAVRLARAGLRLDGPQEDLAEAGRDRTHRGLADARELPARLLQPLVDELAREVDVGAVVEHRRHLRQSVA
jgi:hypothetical protein